MGAQEHSDQDRLALDNEDPTMRDGSDLEEDEEETNIEKSIEQLQYERVEAWKRFKYPGWATPAIWALFVMNLVSVVLTLDQWHGTHSWRMPFDLYPDVAMAGGWNDDATRWAASILGLWAGAYALVSSANPSADKYKFIFALLFISATLHAVSFGKDLYHLNRAGETEECQHSIPDMEIRKYICVFDRFRATVIFDIITCVVGYFVSFFVLYQALTGIVSRRKVYNATKHEWEKIVLMPDDEKWIAFPKAYKKQKGVYTGAVFFVSILNVAVLVLTITQMTGDLFQARDMKAPIVQINRSTPRDVYILPGNQPNGVGHGLGTGSWPELNFEVRLSACTVGLVTLAFLIQWRRDGRTAQLIVLIMLLAAAFIHGAAYFLDASEFHEALTQGNTWAIAQGSRVVTHRYVAMLIFDAFCGFFLFMFSVTNLYHYARQAREPHYEMEGRDYGWWCWGESQVEADEKAALKHLN